MINFIFTQASFLIRDSQFPVECVVNIDRNQVCFTTQSKTGVEKFETIFDAESIRQDDAVMFKINGVFFLEALIRCGSFKVFESCVSFSTQQVKHIVMKMR